jgi:hypothetical protein
LFFIFCFFSEPWFSTDKNIKTIDNYLKALETTIQTVNEKNPNLLEPTEKSLVSCFLELNKYLLYYKKEDFQDYFKKNLSKTWMDFVQDEILQPMVKAITKKDTKNLKTLFESINKDSFKKQIEGMMGKHLGNHFDGKVLWRQYQYILVKILIADLLKINVKIDFDNTILNSLLGAPKSLIYFLSFRRNNEKIIEDQRAEKVNYFFNNHLVKFALDWNILADMKIQIENQPKLSPMDNDTFLQTFKEVPLSSSQSHVSKIKIDGPMEKLIISDKQSEKKSYTIKWQWLIFIISAGIILISPFFNKKKKTTNLNKLIKSTERKIAQISFEINQLKQKTNKY